MGSCEPKYLIYALLDPRFAPEDIRAWRYIGQSTRGMTRPRGHSWDSRLRSDDKKNPPKAAWIRELLRLGTTFNIVCLRSLPEPSRGATKAEVFRCRFELALAERELIALARSEGAPLLNLTAGGENVVGQNNNPARGDRNGSRLHPERLSRGDSHYSRTRPEALSRGEERSQAKLTSAKVIEARKRLAEGEPLIRLAARFGVDRKTLRLAIRGVTWAHVS